MNEKLKKFWKKHWKTVLLTGCTITLGALYCYEKNRQSGLLCFSKKDVTDVVSWNRNQPDASVSNIEEALSFITDNKDSTISYIVGRRADDPSSYHIVEVDLYSW